MHQDSAWLLGTLGVLLAIPSVVFSSNESVQLAIVGWALFCTIGMLFGARRLRGSARSVYTLLALSGLLVTVGAVVRTIIGEATGTSQPLPSLADVLTFPGYLTFLIAIVTIVRKRAVRRNIDAWLDAIALTSAALLLFWAWFLADFITDPSEPLATVTLSTVYNLIVVAAVACLLRIGANPGLRSPSYKLLGVAGVSFVVADLAGTVAAARGDSLYITLALSPIVYGLVFAASWHPSGGEITVAPEAAEEKFSNFRLGASALALTVPVLIAGAPATQTGLGRVGAIALAVITAGALVMRLYRLLSSQRDMLELESRANKAVMDLSTLRTTREIFDGLPMASTEIFGSGTDLDLSSSIPNNPHVQLPEFLTEFTDGQEFVLLEGLGTDPSEERVFHNFIRDSIALASTRHSLEMQVERKAEERVNRSIAQNERRFRALVQNAADVVFVIDKAGFPTYVSPAIEKISGFPTSAYLGRSMEWTTHSNDWNKSVEAFRSVLETGETRRYEIRALDAEGELRLLSCVLTNMFDVEGVDGVVLNATDITEKRMLESDLRNAEVFDPLTLLFNRTTFIAEVDDAIRSCSVTQSSVVVAVINIDDFRLLNEGYGTEIGDQVLTEVASRIRQQLRLGDLVARLNGDEFGVLMVIDQLIDDTTEPIGRILEALSEPMFIENREVSIRATAGLAIDHDGELTGLQIIRNADTAVDAAKTNQRGEVLVFHEGMGDDISRRVEVRNRLRQALPNDELRLVYQPIIDIENGSVVSLEALARWDDPVLGPVRPDVFIPVAEKSGLILELGEWALRSACEQIAQWERDGLSGFTVAVNVSGEQLRTASIIDRFKTILDEAGVAPERITIEITESVLLDDTNFTASQVHAFRKLGFRLAIDDFGTGYSSLSYLQRYEFDILKVDRSFVGPVSKTGNVREREIVRSMIALAQNLGAKAVAEGIEELKELDALASLGCDMAQGWYFYRPLEADDATSMLRSKIAVEP